eukprot:3143718-Pyramimonas_sp.AAC.1
MSAGGAATVSRSLRAAVASRSSWPAKATAEIPLTLRIRPIRTSSGRRPGRPSLSSLSRPPAVSSG